MAKKYPCEVCGKFLCQCHKRKEAAEAAQPTNIAICKMPDWV